jgi:hypothetical protein
MLATGILIYGGYVLKDYLQGKREGKRLVLEKEHEIRDTKRRYREGIIIPINEALGKVQANLAIRDVYNSIFNAEKYGVQLKDETKIAVEKLKELREKEEAKEMFNTLEKLLPLASAITDEETRQAVEHAIVASALTEEVKQMFQAEYHDLNQLVRQAYQKLEKYVTSVD